MIVPSIDIMEGQAVQLRRGRETVIEAGDPLARLDELAVVGEVAVVDLDAALGRGSNTTLIREMIRRAPCRVGGGIRDLEAARRWLDHGAARIVLGTAATPEICAALPAERVIAAVDSERGSVVVEGWRTRTGEDPIAKIAQLRKHVGGFLLTQVEHEGCMGGFDFALVERAVVAAGSRRLTAAGGITTADEIAHLARLGAEAQIGMALYSGRLTLGAGFAALLEKGLEDRLWPTAVCDELGAALGLVWSTRESVAAAIDERRGIYWSRSRQSLWRKGETSGNRQLLLRADLDCDRDALRFTVRQQGGFCHTGERGCWPTRFSLGGLERRLRQRTAAASGGASGTARLLRDPELLAAKLVEEARELAAADSADEVVREAADLVYFTLVAAARSEVGLDEIERELGRRSLRLTRRPMRAKGTAAEAAATGTGDGADEVPA
jgi:phosphoribosyl-ATP pyrophosphohydrolase